MKRFFCMLFAAIFVLSFAACTPKRDPIGPSGTAPGTTTIPPTTLPSTTVPPTAPPPTTVPTQDEDMPQLGEYNGNSYRNDFLNLKCDFPDSWVLASKEELAQISNLTASIMDDEEFAEAIKNSGTVFALYAINAESGSTLNICLENLGLVYGAVLSEQAYAEAAIEKLPEGLASAGMTDIETEIGTIQFLGKEHTCIRVSGTIQEMAFYELLVCQKVGRYVALTTVCTYLVDNTEDVLTLFRPLAE